MAKPPLNHEQQVLALALARKQPLLRARDVAARGLATVTLSRLVTSGQLERVARGVYSLPQRAISTHRSLTEVVSRCDGRGLQPAADALRAEASAASPVGSRRPRRGAVVNETNIGV